MFVRREVIKFYYNTYINKNKEKKTISKRTVCAVYKNGKFLFFLPNY